jgi:hypothetical protein
MHSSIAAYRNLCPTTIIVEFKQAAINAKEAGFDGIERELLPAAALINN